jgi:excisionase family DNA binding protein
MTRSSEPGGGPGLRVGLRGESMGGGKLLRVNVVADRLGVTDRHVRRLISQGKIEGLKLTPRNIRVPETALEEYRRRLGKDEAN